MVVKIPKLTDAQRLAALEIAKQARAERAQVRRDFAARKITLEEILSSENESVKRIRVCLLITAIPGVGEKKARRILEEFKIAPNRRVGGLGCLQQKKLIDWYQQWVEEHPCQN
jgi:guanylate kinase